MLGDVHAEGLGEELFPHRIVVPVVQPSTTSIIWASRHSFHQNLGFSSSGVGSGKHFQLKAGGPGVKVDTSASSGSDI